MCKKCNDNNNNNNGDVAGLQNNNCPNGRLQAQIPIVIARESTQILAEATVPFPEQFPATEIVEVIKNVRDLRIFICRNKAIINGVLDVNVVYKTFEGNYNYRHSGNDPEASFGDVRQIRFNVPFSGFVEVPGARPGDDYIVNFAGVENDCELDTLISPTHVHCSAEAFEKIRLSTIIKVDISIVRDVLVPIRDFDQILDTASNNFN